MNRRQTRPVKIGNVQIGGGAPISVQSMTKTDTRDVESTVAQICSLEAAGCEIVRIAVPDEEAARALGGIRERVRIPIVADIHFDYRLALSALEAGVDALRINPGNIGSRDRVEQVVQAAKHRAVPIRIGVNAGSLEREFDVGTGGSREERRAKVACAMVNSAAKHISILEDLGFQDIVISLKASDVLTTVRANELMAEQCDYPFHAGITEAGVPRRGAVKSAVGLGLLLNAGLGDTIRVSLTGPPEEEVRVGFLILEALNIRRRGPEIISCPTCGRCEIDVIDVVEQVEKRIGLVLDPITVAVMGCVVNGPGEARHADFGIAGGKGVGLLFRHGEVVRKVTQAEMVDALVDTICGRADIER